MTHRLQTWLLRTALLGAFPMALASHGCATHEDEGAYTNPPGFTSQQTKQVAFSPFAFQRDEQNRIVSSTLARRRTVRAAQKRGLEARSDETKDTFRLEASFADSYAEGMRVSTAKRPEAFLQVVPVGAKPARGRIRSDGAVLAYEEAYRGVTSAFGATHSRVEEFLSIASEKEIPPLAYDLIGGPDFGFFEEGEGKLWAFSKDGTGLFAIPAPVADDAAGKRVEGSWKLIEQGEGRYRLVAQLELKNLQFPVLFDPTFETPAWFFNTANSPNARAASAGTYDIARGCTVLFGGISNPQSTTPTLLADTSVRCSTDQKWAANVAAGAPPPGRAYHAMAYYDGSVNPGVYMFGGHTQGAIIDDLWRLSLTCTNSNSASCGPPSTTATKWTLVPQPALRPPPRFAHHMALRNGKIVLWGGVGIDSKGLRDTWEYDGDTNTWTKICDTCFGGSFGLYGSSSATTVDGSGNREVYSIGGYDHPEDNTGNFINLVSHYTGSDWQDATGFPTSIPTDVAGAFKASSPLDPEPRYFQWTAGTANGNILMGSGLTTSASGTATYFNNVWIHGNAWARSPLPTSTPGATTPGRREAAVAVYDETRHDIVLFGGASDTLTALGNGRVYRTVSHDVTMTTSCNKLDGDCENATQTLTVTFPGLTNSSTPLCSDMRVRFARFISDGNGGGLWEALGSNITPTFGTECTASLDTEWDVTTYVNFGALVRDQRYRPQVTGSPTTSICTSAITANSELTGATPKADCLSGSGYDASITCGTSVLNQGDDEAIVDCTDL